MGFVVHPRVVSGDTAGWPFSQGIDNLTIYLNTSGLPSNTAGKGVRPTVGGLLSLFFFACPPPYSSFELLWN